MPSCGEQTTDIIVVFKKDIPIEQADVVMKKLKLSYHEGMDSSKGKLYFYATGPKFIVKVPLSHKDEFMKKIRLKTSIEWFTQEEVAALIALEPSNEVL